MRILIIGSGGREHALAWKLGQHHQVFTAPGNPGSELEGTNVPIKEDNIADLVAFAQKKNIELVVPGPELPLTLGISDAMAQVGIACFGPSTACARLEASKSFAKEIMHKSNVPTANSEQFNNLPDALAYACKIKAPLVVKADGLAAGKGVVVAQSLDEAEQALADMFSGRFGQAGQNVLIEEFLQGEEVSLLCLCDGINAIPLPSAQDHKSAFDHDLGPNTGGMGAYSPAPILPENQWESMTDLAVRPILKTMAAQGKPFIGVLYAGLMITKNGPKVLEYNVRFGDPECQPLLSRIQGDIAPLLLACAKGNMASQRLEIKPQQALGIVLSAKGYPGDYAKGMPILGIKEAEALGDVKVFQAGTRMEGDTLVSSGGRVLCVTALADTLPQAQTKAYAAMDCIHMENSHFRKDIGSKGIKA